MILRWVSLKFIYNKHDLEKNKTNTNSNKQANSGMHNITGENIIYINSIHCRNIIHYIWKNQYTQLIKYIKDMYTLQNHSQDHHQATHIIHDTDMDSVGSCWICTHSTCTTESWCSCSAFHAAYLWYISRTPVTVWICRCNENAAGQCPRLHASLWRDLRPWSLSSRSSIWMHACSRRRSTSSYLATANSSDSTSSTDCGAITEYE